MVYFISYISIRSEAGYRNRFRFWRSGVRIPPGGPCEQRSKFGTQKWDIQNSASFSVLKTEYSRQLVDVTLFCRNGTSKKKNRKIRMQKWKWIKSEPGILIFDRVSFLSTLPTPAVSNLLTAGFLFVEFCVLVCNRYLFCKYF